MISSKDFKISKNTDVMKLLSDLFQVDPTGSAVKYQMELTDIQNDSDSKNTFSEQDLLIFDSGYVSSESYPNLSQDVRNFTALFGSTYCCEQLFSRMINTKTKPVSLLTDEHLTASLRTGYFNFYCWSRHGLLMQTKTVPDFTLN